MPRMLGRPVNGRTDSMFEDLNVRYLTQLGGSLLQFICLTNEAQILKSLSR